jgi:hypothetical protein
MKDLLNMNPLYGEQFRTLMTLTGAAGLGVGSGGGLVVGPCVCVLRRRRGGRGASQGGSHSSLTPPILTPPKGSIDLNDLSRLVDAAASLTSAEDSVLQVGGQGPGLQAGPGGGQLPQAGRLEGVRRGRGHAPRPRAPPSRPRPACASPHPPHRQELLETLNVPQRCGAQAAARGGGQPRP